MSKIRCNHVSLNPHRFFPSVVFVFTFIIGVLLGQLVAASSDFGDAPDPSYPTLLVNAGARHVLGSGVYLGSCVDAEVDGQPSASSTADDLSVGASVFGTCSGNDDEDGVVFTSSLAVGGTTGVQVIASSGCILSAWIDFNSDGDWDDVGEAIFSGQALVAGANNLNFTIPVGAIEGTTYSRFRCTTDGAVMVTGEASDGEVEDYTVTIGPATTSEFPFQMFLPAIIPKNK